MEKQTSNLDLSDSCEDVTGIHAEKVVAGEVQFDGVLGVDGSREERRFEEFGGSDERARDVLHRSRHLSDSREAEIDCLQKFIQESLSGTEYTSDPGGKFARCDANARR